MFTKRKIWLSELLEGGALSIVRDAEIAFAGKLSTPLNDRIVPLQSQDHLERATRSDGTTAFITPEGLSQKIPDQFGLIIAPYPMAALAHVQSKLANHPTLQWDRFETRIHPSAQIDRSASIAPFDVTIGADTVIFPGAIIGPRTAIGARCSIGPNTHIGATGFQKDAGTPGHLMAQSGGVRIADDVTIQSSCVVSRAVFGGFTEINSEVLIDSLVSISHDCVIGSGTVICAKVSLSGGARVAESAYLGPNATISNSISIGTGAQVSLGAVVTEDVPAGQKVSGNFALPHEKWLRLIRQFR